ncbi:urease accessory protein UreF [Leptolyngbya sp. FACHB-321]|uniref:urease accessory protein UreF n=1 Tax=Leptolyngbya sp. FACHB-321 TaxID=2692807 RepID=UPI0016897EA2|nr:urease accessory protein UreF [Leptolyngbya sp. FACHB-321]MBD2034606.1 urease accessory protein UreF [Leptolyngbya sp. FACHB-321]
MEKNNHQGALLRLLQLASPALPVGAYSYSEGLEALAEAGRLSDRDALESWLVQELRYGAIRVETAVMVRAYRACQLDDWDALGDWNRWLSAARETEELRHQSLQMGRSLLRLLQDLHLVELPQSIVLQKDGCHFAIAFALAAVRWQIDLPSAMLGYLHSWASNLVNVGVKLIPLGQTTGQQLLLQLQPAIEDAVEAVLLLQDDDLGSCSWGLALASMAHETQYSRLFRS